MMQAFTQNSRYIIFAVLFFVLGIFVKFSNLNSDISSSINQFQEQFLKKEIQLDSLVQKTKQIIQDNGIAVLFKFDELALAKFIDDASMDILVYESDTLRYWSNNAIQIKDIYNPQNTNRQLKHFGNGHYYVIYEEFSGLVIKGLMRVKNDYSLRNDFLVNEFDKSFDLPADVLIQLKKCKDCFEIRNNQGSTIFSLDPLYVEKINPLHRWVILICYLIGILLMLVYVQKVTQTLEGAAYKQTALMVVVLVVFLLKLAMDKTGLFYYLKTFELFNPRYYAASNYLSSLGDLFIYAVLFFFLINLYYKTFEFISPLEKKEKSTSNFLLLFHITFLVLLYFLFSYSFQNLIINSNISFEAHKILDINIYSFFGLLSIGFLFTSFALFADKTIVLFKEIFNAKNLIVRFLIVCALLCPLFYLVKPYQLFSGLFLILFFVVFVLFRFSKNPNYQYSKLIILVILVSVHSIFNIVHFTSEKEKNNKKVMVENLANEHDPIAELILKRTEEKIKTDKQLVKLIKDKAKTYDDILTYLTNTYFSGYLGKYDFQLTLCSQYDSVLIEPDDILLHCFTFFEDLILDNGALIPETNFYYLNNFNGRISYFGIMSYNDPDSDMVLNLFVELVSRLVTEELGYPELLLDEKKYKPDRLKDYSYAKYFHNDLIAQTGGFPYSLHIDFSTKYRGKFSTDTYDGYNHLIYKVDAINTIVISKPKVTFFDILISFSYIFLFYFVLVSLFTLPTNLNVLEKNFKPTFQNRIQFSMLFILLVSLVLIGTLTITLSITQYENKQNEIISEKIQSVLIELNHKLAYETELTREWSQDTYNNLDELLRKFSNVFYSDINMYDLNGNLLATSRPEIFQSKLIGEKMNPEAYYQLSQQHKAEFMHEEKIGKLKYLSAYVPFRNNNNQLLAYLNLPYFTKQQALTQEVTTLAVTVINIFVILFLITVASAFFISEQITRPLRMLQEKFRNINLGKKNETIEYQGKDEIAELINEYNRMVAELTKNIELLAKTERESAWREMAKQIAHEIKNPLTPMKLSVQHLHRAWEDKKEDWDERLKRFTQTMIEQINSLSAIATEFSNFAKMPQAKNEALEIGTKVGDTIRLFENMQNVDFSFNKKYSGEVFINADREQFMRVLVNLVKNAIQSIPEYRNGKIGLKAELTDNNSEVLISITDNGKGIEIGLMEKLFQPNFTTKSSGMGMGLAIVKNIVETSNGKIWFETTIGKGTTFYLQFPIYNR